MMTAPQRDDVRATIAATTAVATTAEPLSSSESTKQAIDPTGTAGGGANDETTSASDTASDSCSPFGSRETSSADLKALDGDEDNGSPSCAGIQVVGAGSAAAAAPAKAVGPGCPAEDPTTTSATVEAAYSKRTRTSLKERGEVPLGLYVVAVSILVAQYVGGVWRLETLVNWKESMVHAGLTSRDSLVYLRDIMQSVAESLLQRNDGTTTTTNAPVDWREVAYALVVTLLVASTLYVLIGAPLRAGFWTGPRSRKHKLHRYMGMAFLIQYFAAWVEFVTHYDHAKDSYLPHFIAINGLIQGYSAYFSFKVLPDLHDPGYYSDKAVASRKFIHENIYFSWLTTWGSIYYHEGWRDRLQAHPVGQVMEVAFIFFPYLVVRPLFPTTSFGAAGSGRRSRTEGNEAFYRYGTLAIKLFYLWAKYYLGFFVNFLWCLHKTDENETKLIKGMFTLNLGTISIAIFLHTLRFKGVLPPKLTFSIYLLQIYAYVFFSCIPVRFRSSHSNHCGVSIRRGAWTYTQRVLTTNPSPHHFFSPLLLFLSSLILLVVLFVVACTAGPILDGPLIFSEWIKNPAAIFRQCRWRTTSLHLTRCCVWRCWWG